METLKAIARRKSTRSYRQDQISDEVLNTILAAGCAAPVGMGKYDSLHLTVIQDKAVLKNISASISKIMDTEADMLYSAPTVVLISSKDIDIPGVDYVNVGCVLENMAIAAADQKIDNGIVWGVGMAVSADIQLAKALDIPESFKPVGSIALGYATTPNEVEKEMKVTISMNHV